MYYNARYYDAALGRFISADTIVPGAGNPQALNRYSYVLNNPVKYTDPSGHCDPDDCPWRYKRNDDGSAWWDLPKEPKETNKYNPGESTLEAMGLVFDWFFNQGDPTPSYGLGSSITQDVMHDPAMEQFRQVWANAGYPLPFSWQHHADERSNGTLLERVAKGAGVYATENFELAIAIVGLPLGLNDLPPGWGPDSPIDAVGGTLGSLDVIHVYDSGNGMVTFQVYNEMNWASGTRIPGTDSFLIPSFERGGWLPGGTLRVSFEWREPMPRR